MACLNHKVNDMEIRGQPGTGRVGQATQLAGHGLLRVPDSTWPAWIWFQAQSADGLCRKHQVNSFHRQTQAGVRLRCRKVKMEGGSYGLF